MRRLALMVAALSLAAACSGSDRPPQPAAPGPAAGPSAPSPAPGGGEAPPAANPAPGPPGPPAQGPAAVAASLVAAEQAIRSPAVPTAGLEEAARSQQDAYRQLVDHPEWMPQVLAAAPPALHGAIRANVAAGAELRALTKPQTRLPPWRIVAPAPPQELLRYYKAAEADLGIPWQYLAAIHLVETRMGRIRGPSVAGAQGPMQFLPSTWARYGRGDINSNRDAIFAAARLLAANGGPGNMRRALYRYNPTPRYVNAVSAYADQMRDNDRTYFAYYHWQVYYRMVDGDRLLPVGYGA